MPKMITSGRGIAAALSQSVDQTFIFLMVLEFLDSEGRSTSLHYAANYDDVVSNGIGYAAKAFKFNMPTDSADRPPQTQLVIEDIDRRLAFLLRPTERPPTLDLIFVRAEEPDIVEGKITDLLVKNMSIDEKGVLSCDVVWDSLVQEPYPIHRYDPALFPGLFR